MRAQGEGVLEDEKETITPPLARVSNVDEVARLISLLCPPRVGAQVVHHIEIQAGLDCGELLVGTGFNHSTSTGAHHQQGHLKGKGFGIHQIGRGAVVSA